MATFATIQPNMDTILSKILFFNRNKNKLSSTEIPLTLLWISMHRTKFEWYRLFSLAYSVSLNFFASLKRKTVPVILLCRLRLIRSVFLLPSPSEWVVFLSFVDYNTSAPRTHQSIARTNFILLPYEAESQDPAYNKCWFC